MNKIIKKFENWTGSLDGWSNKAEADMRRSGEEIMRKAREEAERKKAEQNKCNCENCDCENCSEEGCDCGCCGEVTNEKSTSKSQQRLMGQAYAYKKGDIKAKDLNPEYADEIKDLAKSMTKKQLKDFAETKHKGLPQKVKENKIVNFQSFNEGKYSYEDFTLSDMQFVQELYEEGMTDPGDIAREMDWKDMSKETVEQIIYTLKKRGDIE